MKNAHALEVLFEDQWIIVINKPSGMLSVGYPGYNGKSAQDILFDMHRSKGKVRIAAVHRIDRDTSGVMMFARTADAKAEIMDGWQEIVGERTYRCVCARASGAEPLPDAGHDRRADRLQPLRRRLRPPQRRPGGAQGRRKSGNAFQGNRTRQPL